MKLIVKSILVEKLSNRFMVGGKKEVMLRVLRDQLKSDRQKNVYTISLMLESISIMRMLVTFEIWKIGKFLNRVPKVLNRKKSYSATLTFISKNIKKMKKKKVFDEFKNIIFFKSSQLYVEREQIMMYVYENSDLIRRRRKYKKRRRFTKLIRILGRRRLKKKCLKQWFAHKRHTGSTPNKWMFGRLVNGKLKFKIRNRRRRWEDKLLLERYYKLRKEERKYWRSLPQNLRVKYSAKIWNIFMAKYLNFKEYHWRHIDYRKIAIDRAKKSWQLRIKKREQKNKPL